MHSRARQLKEFFITFYLHRTFHRKREKERSYQVHHHQHQIYNVTIGVVQLQMKHKLRTE